MALTMVSVVRRGVREAHHLSQIEQHVATGERLVWQQHELVVHLERHRRNSQWARETLEIARAILAQLELSLAWQTSIRDCIQEGHLTHAERRVNQLEVRSTLPAEDAKVKPPEYARSVNDLDLSRVLVGPRARNCLINEEIATIGELLKRTPIELRRVPNMGDVSIMEIHAALEKLNVPLPRIWRAQIQTIQARLAERRDKRRYTSGNRRKSNLHPRNLTLAKVC